MIRSRFAPAALLVSVLLFSSSRADAQRRIITPAQTIEKREGNFFACCVIVAVDAETGLVTAKVNANGNVFQFKFNGVLSAGGYRAAPVSLKPGQAVYANFTNHQVSLDGRTVCCTMTSEPQVPRTNKPIDSWTTKAAMPTARSFPAAGVANGILYVVGGGPGPLATVEAYDPATNTWMTKASMHFARNAPAAGAVNNILYVAGGSDFSHNYTETVQAYNPAANTWTITAPMHVQRSYAAAGVVKGVLYVIGGIGGPGGGATGVLGIVEAYDPATNVWTTKAAMPTPRHQAVVGAVNGILYVAGGGLSSGVVATVEAYNPATNTWTTKAPMPTPRVGAAAGVVNGILYVAGGSGSVTTVEAYDPATDIWTTMKAPIPVARVYAASGVVNGILYVAGGLSPTQNAATVDAYQP